jgi:hypothetical protein
VTLEGLCNALEAFGPLRPNGVILKQQRGKESYAFVDFLAPESAQVSPITTRALALTA